MESNKYINVGGVQIAESVYLKIRIEARNEALEEAFGIMEDVIKSGNGQEKSESLSISIDQVRTLCDGARFAATRYMKEYDDLIEEARQKKASIERDYRKRMEEADEHKRNTDQYCERKIQDLQQRLSAIRNHEQELFDKELNEKEQKFKEASSLWFKQSKEALQEVDQYRRTFMEGVSEEEVLIILGELMREDKDGKWSVGTKKDENYRTKIAELKASMKSDRIERNDEYREERKDVIVDDDRYINPYAYANIRQIISAYFELASENILANSRKIGFKESVAKMRELRDAVNVLMKPCGVKIEKDYFEKKLKLLKTVCAYDEYKENMKEDARIERERLREEARAQREYERELRKAEKDEETARRKIEEMQRKAEAEKHNAERYALYEKQIAELETALQTAVERQERAKSMAQQTRRGFVYVISNIGSFGEGVYKIGLTRRLDPQERVDELGDASVPFRFDVHAMIESEDAPALESALHQAFADRRVNKMNGRKEFFRVSLEEIEAEVLKSGIHANFRKEAYAKEYRDSVVM